MTRGFILALSLLLPVAAAQGQGTVKGPGGYEYTPGLTPAQQEQLRTRMDQQLAPPKLVGRTVDVAITAVLNESRQISGLVGPLPRELAEALNRAAIRTPVQLVLATQSAQGAVLMPRVKRMLLPTASATTMLATSDLLITIDAKGVTVYQSAFLAAQVHQNVQQLLGGTTSRSTQK